MSKLALTCACGQEMAVPENAIGKKGLCPDCGTEIRITKKNTSPWRKRRGGGLLALSRGASPPALQRASEDDAARQFAESVDLYNQRRYAEALTVLNGLRKNHPDNPHIEAAQGQCALALQRSTAGGTQYAGEAVAQDILTPELVKSVVLDKMLNASTDDAQLQAADLAAQLLGMYGPLTAFSEIGEDDPPEVMLAKPTRKAPAKKKAAKRKSTAKTRNGRAGTTRDEIP